MTGRTDLYDRGPGSRANEDDEPTAGLLSALVQQDQASALQEGKDDLYSVSPQPEVHRTGIASSERNIEKRTAEEQFNTERAAKRVRPSTVAEAVLSNTSESLPGPDPVTDVTGVPATVMIDQPTSSFVTAPEPSQQAAAEQAAPGEARASVYAAPSTEGDAGDDDSDFEMPPLTMEPDTEDEDEDGGEDKDEEG